MNLDFGGNFKSLIEKINPKSKLIFEFKNQPDSHAIAELKKRYTISINGSQLSGELEDEKIKLLLIDLLKIDSSQKSICFIPSMNQLQLTSYLIPVLLIISINRV